MCSFFLFFFFTVDTARDILDEFLKKDLLFKAMVATLNDCTAVHQCTVLYTYLNLFRLGRRSCIMKPEKTF